MRGRADKSPSRSARPSSSASARQREQQQRPESSDSPINCSRDHAAGAERPASNGRRIRIVRRRCSRTSGARPATTGRGIVSFEARSTARSATSAAPRARIDRCRRSTRAKIRSKFRSRVLPSATGGARAAKLHFICDGAQWAPLVDAGKLHILAMASSAFPSIPRMRWPIRSVGALLVPTFRRHGTRARLTTARPRRNTMPR